MNCTSALGIVGAQVLSQTEACVQPAPTEAEGAGESFFAAILGAQSGLDTAAEGAVPPAPWKFAPTNECEMPICLFPTVSQCPAQPQPAAEAAAEQFSLQSLRQQGLLPAVGEKETRATKAFRVEQTENTPAPGPDFAPLLVVPQPVIVPAPVEELPSASLFNAQNAAPAASQLAGQQLPGESAPAPAVSQSASQPDRTTNSGVPVADNTGMPAPAATQPAEVEAPGPQPVSFESPSTDPQHPASNPQAMRADSAEAAPVAAESASTRQPRPTLIAAGTLPTANDALVLPSNPEPAVPGAPAPVEAEAAASRPADQILPAPIPQVMRAAVAPLRRDAAAAFEWTPTVDVREFQEQTGAVKAEAARPAEAAKPVMTALDGLLTLAPEPQPAEAPKQTQTTPSLAAPLPAKAVRVESERAEKAPVPVRESTSNYAAPAGPRMQTVDTPVRAEMVRPAPGVEMTQRIEAIHTAQAAARPSVQAFTIPIGHETNPVATLRLVQQGTGVRMTVQTSDAALSQSMQANLPQLIRGLEDSGFRANFQARSESTPATIAPTQPGAPENRDAGTSDRHGAQQDGPAHEQSREKKQPAHEWRQWLQHGRKQKKDGN